MEADEVAKLNASTVEVEETDRFFGKPDRSNVKSIGLKDEYLPK